MEIALYLSAGIALLAAIHYYSRRESRRRDTLIQQLFAGRPARTPQGFYEHHFLAQGIKPEVVTDIRQILQEILDADMSYLQADDDFSKNLSFFWDFDSMANVELVIALEKHFQISISDAEAEQTHTVAQLVQLVHGKLTQAKAA